MNDHIKGKLSSIPTSPGIYFFKDKRNQIIYIGKAKSLRNRVRSYFTSTHKKDAKTQVLVRNIVDIDYLVVRSETEALLTESNLIKQHRPRYNVFLKDDKTSMLVLPINGKGLWSTLYGFIALAPDTRSVGWLAPGSVPQIQILSPYM